MKIEYFLVEIKTKKEGALTRLITQACEGCIKYIYVNGVTSNVNANMCAIDSSISQCSGYSVRYEHVFRLIAKIRKLV